MNCNRCKKDFERGNRPDGLPNGVGYELEDGTFIHMCTDCIIDLGGLVLDESIEFKIYNAESEDKE